MVPGSEQLDTNRAEFAPTETWLRLYTTGFIASVYLFNIVDPTSEDSLKLGLICSLIAGVTEPRSIDLEALMYMRGFGST